MNMIQANQPGTETKQISAIDGLRELVRAIRNIENQEHLAAKA